MPQSPQPHSASKAQRHCQHAQDGRRENFYPTTLPLTLLHLPLTLLPLKGLKKREGIDFYIFYGLALELHPFSSPELSGTKKEQAREGKLFLYWMTTTSTSTSYTATTTISSLRCTPSGFTISNCD